MPYIPKADLGKFTGLIVIELQKNSLLRELQVFANTKNIMLIEDKGVQAGIDDYITKPFSIREIMLRIEMLLRRMNKFKEKLLKDPLTGAYSRYFLNDRISEELERFK